MIDIQKKYCMNKMVRAAAGYFLLSIYFVCAGCIAVGRATNDTDNLRTTSVPDVLFGCEMYHLMTKAKQSYRVALIATERWNSYTDLAPLDWPTKLFIKMINSNPCNQKANESLVEKTLDIYSAMLDRVFAGLRLVNESLQRSQEYALISSALKRVQRGTNGPDGLQEIVKTLRRAMKANAEMKLRIKSKRKANAKAVRECRKKRNGLRCLYSVLRKDAKSAAAIYRSFRWYFTDCGIRLPTLPC